jgi:3-oxoacyl-[acyl-carrier-protein] synthase III
MIWENLYISGVGTYLPSPVDAKDAVAAGKYPAEEFRSAGMLSAREENELEAVDMAVLSAEQAVKRSAVDTGAVGLLLHSSLGQWGSSTDVLTPATYIQRRVLGGAAPSMYVNSASNGGMASLELAASWLSARDPRGDVLVTSASRFALPDFDRWRTDTGLVYGDGAASVVVSGRSGFVRVLATRSDSVSELEPVYRAASGAGPAEGMLDMASEKRRFVEKHGPSHVIEMLQAAVSRNVLGLLDECSTPMSAIKKFVVPNVGRLLIRLHYSVPLKIGLDRTLWDWGRTTGHIGSSDQFAGLAHLLEAGHVSTGDRVVLLGLGAGFNITSAVVEVQEIPGWLMAGETTNRGDSR